jgi:acetyl-CoA C-acetyltransferase
VNLFSSSYGNAPRLLAERVGAKPAEEIYTTIGGNTPQWLVNVMAARIVAGEVGVVLLAGAEPMRTVARAPARPRPLAWGGGDGTPTVMGGTRDGVERARGRARARAADGGVPALRERASARRAAGRSPSTAAARAHSARGSRPSPRTTRTPGSASGAPPTRSRPSRRRTGLIGFPYPKLMNAIIDVDQAAAVILTSAGRARAPRHPGVALGLRSAAAGRARPLAS